jgi:anti-anti-sigma regulatory factor
MFMIRRSSPGRRVVYFVMGRIDGEALSELQRLLSGESAGTRVILDLEDVRQVGAEAVEFFARCKDAGIKLRNCPAYVREWIASSRQQGWQSRDSITSFGKQISERS